MAIVKLLNCGDFHDHEDMYTLDATVELANRLGVHGLVYCGDLVDAKKYVPEFIANKEKYKAQIQKIEETKNKKLEEGLEEQEKTDLGVFETVHNIGLQKLMEISQQSTSEEQKRQAISTIQYFMKRKNEIIKTLQKHEKLITDENKALQKIDKICAESVLEKITKFYSKANDKLAQIKAERLFIRGNHDIDNIYDHVTNARFLEENGTVNLNGLRIAGAPNTNEFIPGLPQFLFQKMMEDHFIESLDNLKQIPEEAVKKQDVYQRLKDEEIDYLVTHKGLDEFANGHGFGAGLAQLVQEKKPSIIVSGHVHSYMYSDEHGYEGLRIGPKTAVVTHVNTETKEIEQLDIYERVGANS